jgi:hypothetical protein
MGTTLAAALFLGTRVDPTYEAIASVLISGPPSTFVAESPEDSAGGPSAAEPESGAVTPAIVSAIVTGDSGVGRLVEEGASPDFVITADNEGIMRVEATAATREEAVSSVNEILGEMERVIDRRQEEANVLNSQKAQLQVLAEPTMDQTDVRRGNYRAEAAAIIDRGSGVASPFQDLYHTARVIEVAMMAPTTRADVLEGSGGLDYIVEQVPRDTAPLLFITVTGPDRSPVGATLERAIDKMQQLAADRQAQEGVDRSRWIEFDVLSIPDQAGVVSSNLLRPLVTIIALGGIAAVSLAVLYDSWARRDRRGLRPSDGATDRRGPRSAPRLNPSPHTTSTGGYGRHSARTPQSGERVSAENGPGRLN